MKFDWQIAVEVVQDNSVQCVFSSLSKYVSVWCFQVWSCVTLLVFVHLGKWVKSVNEVRAFIGLILLPPVTRWLLEWYSSHMIYSLKWPVIHSWVLVVYFTSAKMLFLVEMMVLSGKIVHSFYQKSVSELFEYDSSFPWVWIWVWVIIVFEPFRCCCA